MVSTRLATDDDGRPVLVKEGDATVLTREAAVLTAARHPGVVEMAAWEPAAGRLTLRWAGSRTLADARLPAVAAARVGAALASTVADLHAIGIRHGRIAPQRVVLDGDGRPILCGFGAASLPGEPGPAPADDVAGVGEVLRAVAGPGDEPEPIPERRFARRGAAPDVAARALLTLADHATADDPARRPTARALAAALAALAAEPEPRRARRPPAAALAALAAVAAGALLAGALVSGSGSAPAAPRPAPRPAPPTTAGGPQPVVEAGGARYAVGRPGDEVAVADWDCDGQATVALVRPATGEVFVFDRWGDQTVRPVATVAGALRVEAADPDGDGCVSLVAVGADGRRTEVGP